MAEANKKEKLFARIGRWLREMRSELKKVVWPGKSQILKNLLIVIACVIVVGIFVCLSDAIAQFVRKGIFDLVALLRG